MSIRARGDYGELLVRAQISRGGKQGTTGVN